MKRLAIAWSHARNGCGKAYHATRGVYDREVEDARKANKNLTGDEVMFVAVSALAVVVLTVMMRAMYLSKYATMTTADFQAYHPVVPWLALISSVLYVTALYLKNVRYWLAYFPAAMTAVFSAVFLLLYHGIMDPSHIKFMDFGPDWWRGT